MYESYCSGEGTDVEDAYGTSVDWAKTGSVTVLGIRASTRFTFQVTIMLSVPSDA